MIYKLIPTEEFKVVRDNLSIELPLKTTPTGQALTIATTVDVGNISTDVGVISADVGVISADVGDKLSLSGGAMVGTLSVLSPANIVATGPLQCTGLAQFTNRMVATGPLINGIAAKFDLAKIVTRTNSVAGHSEGLDCIGEGSYCHAEGELTIAGGRNSLSGWDKGCHAEGLETSALGSYSHAEGSSSVSKDYGHAEGVYTYAAGAHAEGNYTSAFGMGSHTEGFRTQTSGVYSHADGQYAKTEHHGAFAWSGVNYASNPVYYVDHGEGTFNVNPKPISGDTDPATGFYIGEKTLKTYLDDVYNTLYPVGTVYFSVNTEMDATLSTRFTWSDRSQTADGLYYWTRIAAQNN